MSCTQAELAVVVILDTQFTVELMPSDYASLLFLSITTPEWWFALIAIPSWPFCSGLNYNSMNKELLVIFEAFKWWRHTSKLWTSDWHGHQSPVICNTFQWPKILTHRQAWCQISFSFNLIICFIQESSESNPMHSLDNGMSIFKEGNMTMPVVNPQNFCLVFVNIDRRVSVFSREDSYSSEFSS